MNPRVAKVVARPAVADYPAGARLGPRVIGDFEFVWMLRGRARFLGADGEIVLGTDRLLLVPPAVRHSFVWDERGPSRHGYVHFDGGHLAERVPEARWRPMTDEDPLRGLCAYLVWLGQEQPSDYEGRVRQTVRFLCDTFTSDALPSSVEMGKMPGAISAAVRFLRSEWSTMPLRRVTVGELAAASHVSRSYLNRAFQAAFGVSAGSALEQLRCSRAETLLLRTNMTMGSIARQCAFADLYHFSHRFRRTYGISPSAYRVDGGASALDHDGIRRLAHAVWG